MQDNRFNRRKKGWFFLMIPAMLALATALVMWLWNAILPGVLKVGEINFWQAGGIFILSRILFGGFGPRGGGRWGNRGGFGGPMGAFKERFKNMSEEEKETFKKKWKERCGR